MQKISNELDKLRAQIDKLDREIIEKIHLREEIVLQVKKYKEQHNLQVFDAKREEFLDIYHTQLSLKYHVSVEFIKKLFKLIMDESKHLQLSKNKDL